MKITINGQEKDLISYIKDDMKLKKVTIGITITDEIETINGDQKTVEPASFTMVIATPDNNWTKPMFITGSVTEASELISNTLSNPPKAKVKTTNAEEIEVEQTVSKEKKQEIKDKVTKKIADKKKTEAVEKSKVKDIDWTSAKRFMDTKDWAKARYVVNVTMRQQYPEPENIILIDRAVTKIDKLASEISFGEEINESQNS